jgi:hypothetical protein
MVALMAQVAAAQNSMMKDPLQESSRDELDHQCPPSQLQALDVEQDTLVELAELIG